MSVDEKEFPVRYDNMSDLIIAGGSEIRGLQEKAIPRKKLTDEPVLESYKFVAHLDSAEMSLHTAVHVATHIALENQMTLKAKMLEVFEKHENSINALLSPIILDTLDKIPLIQADVGILSSRDTFMEGSVPQNFDIVNLNNPPADEKALLLSGHNLLMQQKSELLTRLLPIVKDGGFVLTLENGDVSDIITLARKHNLSIIFEKIVNKSMLFLLRKQQKIPIISAVVHVNNNTFGWVDELKAAMKIAIDRGSGGNSRVLVVGEKPFENGVLGLFTSLRKEPGGGMVRCFLIQDEKAPSFTFSNPLYIDQLNLDLAVNVLRPNGKWGSYRHFRLPSPAPRLCTHVRAKQLVAGDLSSLQWFEGPIEAGFRHPDLVTVVYSAINFRDVMLASGKLTPEVVAETRTQEDYFVGSEYSGVDLDGCRIMGLISSGALTNRAVIDRDLSWYVPKNWTLEDAATVPCAYATSYYALYLNGHMKEGDKVLIHSGSGGVSQAAITLALNEGCEVFTTVGTVEQRRFIRERFPQIPDDHIGSSRDTSFEQLVLEQTNGRGVDIVMNSLAGEKLHASIRCVAFGGEFLEIGKFDMPNDRQISMLGSLRNIIFYAINLYNSEDVTYEQKFHLKALVQKGLDDGSIKPLTRTVFSQNQVEEAYNYMAAGKHIGKVIINILDEKNPHEILLPALPCYHCSPDRSYVILGGLGGFGLELTDWLVLRGARNLVLTSRSGLKNGYQRMRVALWRSYGVRVLIVSGKDAANREECVEILRAAADLAPVDAIFNLAAVIKGGLLENQTPHQFVETFEPKAWSTRITDEVSRIICLQLRHFVAFSSVTSSRGNAGQTNYGMSNSIMERICEKRVAEGLPGLAIEWGAIGDVGLPADIQDNKDEIIMAGTVQQKISSCLQLLDNFLTQNEPTVSSLVLAEKKR